MFFFSSEILLNMPSIFLLEFSTLLMSLLNSICCSTCFRKVSFSLSNIFFCSSKAFFISMSFSSNFDLLSISIFFRSRSTEAKISSFKREISRFKESSLILKLASLSLLLRIRSISLSLSFTICWYISMSF